MGSDHVLHYNDVIMPMMASHITSLAIVYSTVYSRTDQRKYQSSVLCHGHIYSLRCVCGGDLCPPNRTAALRFLCKPYGDLTVLSTPQGHRKPCGFFNLTLNFFQKPQCRNHTTRPPYGGRTIALRWPWGGIRILPDLGCLENRTAASRRPCDGLTAAVRQTCDSCKNREVAAYGHLPVSLRSPYGFWSHESYDRRAVAVTFVTTTTTAHKTLRFLKITLRTVDHRTVRRPYGGSLPERTRGRLRVRIRSIEKTSSWKFYPAAQNFTNRMLFRNTYIFKTI